MFTVLFTAAGRRVELIQAFRESFSKHSLKARIIGVDLNPGFAPACHFTDVAYQAPKCTDPEYLHRLLEICHTERVDLLIPLYEPEFILLDRYRERFERTGTFVLLSNKHVIETCQDKYSMHCFFKAQKINTPQTWMVNDLPKQVTFPLFAKPRLGMGSVGVQKISFQLQLEQIRQSPDYIIQQYITGTEYTLDILADFTGRVLSVVPRERLEVRAGEVSKSRTVKRRDLIEQGKYIAEKLGIVGPVNIQCIATEKAVYWIEINPRFGGGVPLSIRAGVDYPYLLYRFCQGEKVEPFIGQFQDHLTMLRYDQAVYV